jgi:hypothetical protein
VDLTVGRPSETFFSSATTCDAPEYADLGDEPRYVDGKREIEADSGAVRFLGEVPRAAGGAALDRTDRRWRHLAALGGPLREGEDLGRV